jgi:hypothetical protein
VFNLWAATLETHYRAIPWLGRGGSLTARPDALQQKYKLLFLNSNFTFLVFSATPEPSKPLF